MPLFKKKAEMPTPEEIEAGKVKSYKDLIAPSVVSFRRSPGYYILGNTYRCVWAIRSYAETVEKDSPEIALLRELGESDGITLHIYTRHILSLLIEVGISTPPIISAICISTVSSPLPTNRIMNVPPVGIWPILKTPIANLHSQK